MSELRSQTRQAARLLTADLRDPPTVEEVCGEIGISEFRLKKGFREIFETTAGAYLRAARMEKAAELLSDTDFTVGVVASEVGYANPSRFAEAFRRHHGCNPGEFPCNADRINEVSNKSDS